MVIVRIKEDEDKSKLPKYSDDDIKIITKLKICKLITTDIDEKVEKKIEYLIASKPENQIIYTDDNDEYTIFGFNENNAVNKNTYSNSSSYFKKKKKF
jgi:hypothetical protein